MEILVVAKTRMSDGFCVGGIVLQSGRLVRLLNRGNNNQPRDTRLEVGQVWDIEFINRNPITPPHTEDIIVLEKEFVGNQVNMSQYLINLDIPIWRGGIQTLFDGNLRWTNNGSGYISETQDMPEQSVGFWISDRNLTYNEVTEKYSYPIKGIFTTHRKVKYKGVPPARDIIPVGTLIRVSLARLYKPPDIDIEKRCYLQLSGWYE